MTRSQRRAGNGPAPTIPPPQTVQNFYIVMAPADIDALQPGAAMTDSHPLISLICSAMPGQRMDASTTAPPCPETFADVANEWFANNAPRWARSYSLRLRGRLDCGLLKTFGRRPLSEIGPMEVLEAVRSIEKRDALETARRVLRIAGAVFRYGVATGRCQRDPTQDLKGALKPPRPVRNRASLAANELPAFLKALHGYASVLRANDGHHWGGITGTA